MRPLAFDTETCLIRPGALAPELVCVTWKEDRQVPRIEHVTEARPIVESWLRDPKIVLVGHNVAFDLAVFAQKWPDLLPLIFDKYEQDGVTDTKIRQQLLDIAGGQYRGFMGNGNQWVKRGYTLEEVAHRCAGIKLKKDGWRLRYVEFLAYPLSEWPARARELQEQARLALSGLLDEDAAKDLRAILEDEPEQVIRYALMDAEATFLSYQTQEKHADFLKDQYRQARHAWWQHLMSAWGLRTNPAAVAELRRRTEEQIAEIQEGLVQAGLVREDGSRDTKAAAAAMVQVCQEKGLPVRLTPKGGVCLDSDACNATEDPILQAYAELTTLKTILNKDCAALEKGVTYPIHSRFDLAETGRSTSSNPNVQNWSRGEKGVLGPRECFVPREGFVFAQADYDQLELRTLAQCCIKLVGHSSLGLALNAGLDPHTALAGTILGISYEEARKRRLDKDDKEFENARQTAKVANFGFPGGLGAKKLVLFARKTYGVILTEERAWDLRRQWLNQWPEMTDYFGYINQLCANAANLATFKHLFTDRYRGGATYTAACNSHFQGLGADATKRAGFLISHACYVDKKNPLYGSRIVNYVHDEFIVETPDNDNAHDAAHELARLMIVGANEFLPDVPAKTEPLLMRVWSKEAKPVLDSRGRLVPWQVAP